MNSQAEIVADGRRASKDKGEAKKGLATAGGVLGAVAAASCCIAPLVLFSLGISGAWIGVLPALKPYQPIFIVMTLGFLGAGFWMVYGKPEAACAEGAACTRPLPNRIMKTALWGATLLVAAALAFPYAAPLFLDY